MRMARLLPLPVLLSCQLRAPGVANSGRVRIGYDALKCTFQEQTLHYRCIARCTGSSAGSGASDNLSSSGSLRKKRRLDDVCRELYPEFSRNVIQSFIAQGKVLVNDKPVVKSGAQVDPTKAEVRVTAQVPKYVCRAGLKMERALEDFFGLEGVGSAGRQDALRGRVALDAGLSTGGFTDCILQHGADHVFGVDVGYGQVAEKIRVDERVTVMERTNLRHLRKADFEQFPECRNRKIDFVSLDVSFISTLKIREAICDIMEEEGDLILLIKPQFEAGKGQVGAGGVVRDPNVRREVVAAVIHGWQDAGFSFQKLIQSPIKGAASGNTEYLCHFTRGKGGGTPVITLHSFPRN